MRKLFLLLMFTLFLSACTEIEVAKNELPADSSELTVETTESSKKYKPRPKSRSTMTGVSSSEEQNTSHTSTQKPKEEATEDQKDLLIAFTQQDLRDYGYEYKYEGEEKWNVAIQEIDEEKKFIITTKDKNLKRIKTIYEWSGDKKDGATLMYFLVNGEEHVNKLN